MPAGTAASRAMAWLSRPFGRAPAGSVFGRNVARAVSGPVGEEGTGGRSRERNGDRSELPTENRPIRMGVKRDRFCDKVGIPTENARVVAFDSGLKLSLGDVVITPGAIAKLPPQDVTAALQKHARGEWGELDIEDSQLNDLRLQEGGSIAEVPPRLDSVLQIAGDVGLFISSIDRRCSRGSSWC